MSENTSELPVTATIHTKLEDKVFSALGQASMCWSSTPTGVFDDAAAKKIGEDLIKDIRSDVLTATNTLFNSLRSNPDFYYAWQANIAMAFQDAFDRTGNIAVTKENVHELSNTAAKNFLDLLIKIPA